MMFALLLASAKLVFSGSIGQSQPPGEPPVPWTDCAWVARDANSVVHFPDGWCVRANRLEREVCAVPGTVLSDGEGELFYFYPPRAELGRVGVNTNGLAAAGAIARLHAWNLKLSVAPHSCRAGFAARARFFALDRKQKAVFAWTEQGLAQGKVFSYADAKDPFVSLAIHPVTGDLLLGTGWPENKISRFRVDGSERVDHIWPAKGYALTLANAGGKTWVLGANATVIAETRAESAQCRFGLFSNNVRAIAEVSNGWWLATSQGAQFYYKDYPAYCARRVGGLANLSALALNDGRILAGNGWRIFNFWLDDQAPDALTSDDTWTVAKHWNESIDRIEVKDRVFYIRDAKSGDVTGFDPRVTAWVFRAKRQFPVKDFTFTSNPRHVRMGAYEVVAEGNEIRLMRTVPNASLHANEAPSCIQEINEKATCLAAQDDWLIAYLPLRKAIFRYRLIAD